MRLAVFALLLALPAAGLRSGGGDAPPEQLSATGLYADPAKLVVDPANRPYSPQYPLWSDGAQKARWIRLPEGGRIDASNPDAWVFPPGTKLWKEFTFAGRKVETRLMWRAPSGSWKYATYVWNASQTEARLAPEDGLKHHASLGDGLAHSIPAVKDCRTCHENGGPEVLGFNALQLSPDRDPLAPHGEPWKPGMLDLSTLLAEGTLQHAPAAWAERPPKVPARTPRERAVLGYLAANCANCHPGSSGVLARLGLDFRVPSRVADPLALPWRESTLDVSGKTTVPDAPEGETRRLRPGAPDHSLVTFRMASRRPARQMPPVGSVKPDEVALALLRAWIAEDLAPARR
ncbi:MAG: hypothetical protein U0P81_03230 [Holophagaceae bacterium]